MKQQITNMILRFKTFFIFKFRIEVGKHVFVFANVGSEPTLLRILKGGHVARMERLGLKFRMRSDVIVAVNSLKGFIKMTTIVGFLCYSSTRYMYNSKHEF